MLSNADWGWLDHMRQTRKICALPPGRETRAGARGRRTD